MIIDMHAHILTEETLRLMRSEAPDFTPSLIRQADGTTSYESRLWRSAGMPAGLWDTDVRLVDMERTHIDLQALAVAPFTFSYELPVDVTAAFSRIQNEQLASEIRAHPGRFAGLATLPMQDPERAVEELRYAIGKLGLNGICVCTNVNQRNLDEPEFRPIFAALEELGGLLVLHPFHVAAADRLSRYYLRNLIGNPLDSTIAAASLIFGGVLDQFPRLRVVLVHGGGYVPYALGRFEHGHAVRPESKLRTLRSPSDYLGQLYFDTITHSESGLRYLVSAYGSDHVVIGTDYPFDMGPADPVGEVRRLGLPKADRERVLGGNAAKLLALAGNVGAPTRSG